VNQSNKYNVAKSFAAPFPLYHFQNLGHKIVAKIASPATTSIEPATIKISCLYFTKKPSLIEFFGGVDANTAAILVDSECGANPIRSLLSSWTE
jgi:hypothetical protein